MRTSGFLAVDPDKNKARFLREKLTLVSETYGLPTFIIAQFHKLAYIDVNARRLWQQPYKRNTPDLATGDHFCRAEVGDRVIKFWACRTLAY